MREGRDGAEDVLRPPHEEVLSHTRRALALVLAVALATGACAGRVEVDGVAGSRASPARSGAVAPPVPSRNTAAADDPVERARFACAVEVQRAQAFDPGISLRNGALLGAIIVGAIGASLGALFGLLSDVPGKSAAAGAIVGGGAGALAGGLFKLEADTAAYHRGLAACLVARPSAPPAAPPAPGLVEYRLRVLNVRHDAFASFLSTAELADGATGPGLMRLASAADEGVLGRGTVLYDRHVAPVEAAVARAWGATPVEARVKLGGAGADHWDEARWYGRPGERTVWVITARNNRRPAELRRIALSDVTALAQFRPLPAPLFGARPEAAVAVAGSYLHHAQERGAAGAYLDRTLDRARALSAVVAVNDDLVFPDRVYLVVTHAASAATYEALLAWGGRGEERELPRDR
jgi:hypothetical protein